MTLTELHSQLPEGYAARGNGRLIRIQRAATRTEPTWNSTHNTADEALAAAHAHHAQAQAAARAAKTEPRRPSPARWATCSDCGHTLNDFDLVASPVQGMCFDCC